MLQRYRLLLSINPMCGIIDGYRSAILGTPWDLLGLAISSTTAVALFLFGLFYFRKVERLFADIA
jgi:lipopolysaccharide transport system permease protein